MSGETGRTGGDGPVFVCACQRSGTTLLGAILGGHPDFLVTPESQFKQEAIARVLRGELREGTAEVRQAIGRHWRFRIWGRETVRRYLQEPADDRDVRDAIMGAVEAYAASRGKTGWKAWVDHTGLNIRDVGLLRSYFPNARFIHLVRDPRGVLASMLPMDGGVKIPADLARLWAANVGFGLAAEARFPESVHRLRFEDLVARPREALEPLCRFLGIELHEGMLRGGGFEVPRYTKAHHRLIGQAPDPARIDAWRKRLSPRQIAIVEYECRELLEFFGYDPLLGRGAVKPSVVAYGMHRIYDDVVASPLRKARKLVRAASRI